MRVDHHQQLLLSSSVPSEHPNRLTKFDDDILENRVMTPTVMGINKNMNSLNEISTREFYCRPKSRIMSLLTPHIINEVEQALIMDLTAGQHHILVNSGACSSFKAIDFKESAMKKSQLGPVIIDAALVQIIDHLKDHPMLVSALGKAKIGYHNKNMMLEDTDVRTFVIKGFLTNTAN